MLCLDAMLWMAQNGFRPSRVCAALTLMALAGSAAMPAAAASTITNLLQLGQAVESRPRVNSPVHIEGTVWWSSETEGRVILQDDSGVTQLELDLPGPIPPQGARIRLTGEAALVKARDAVKLSGVPVVENDGLHAAEERSGSAELNAGRHPIRVIWFNRTDRYELEVGYEGPGLPRQKIPDSALFRAQVESSRATTNFVSGLDYRCSQGLWWSVLPNLNHLRAVKVGVVSNFDLGVRSRDEHVALEFNGFLSVPRDGLYTFYTRSDDGSRLFIGQPSLQLEVVGQAALPTPAPVIGRPASNAEPEYSWAEIEGTVGSVNHLEGVQEIDLSAAFGRLRVKIAETPDLARGVVPENRVRVAGACRLVRDLSGSRLPGEVYVQRWSDVKQSYVTPELWARYPQSVVSNLVTMNPGGDPHPIVHIRGRIHSAGPGEERFLEDASGRIRLETEEVDFASGQPAAVLGRLYGEGTNRWVRGTLIQRERETPGERADRPMITSAEQVHRLSREELSHGYAVKLRGVVTAVLQGDAAVVHDGTRGIYVSIGEPVPLQVGDFCEVVGRTAPGEFSPFVLASDLTVLGAGEMPVPVQPSWDQLLNGSLHCQYVELEGVVSLLKDDTITLLTRDGRIRVQLDSMASRPAPEIQNALVRVRGCLFASWDVEQQRVRVGDVRLNQDWLDVEVPAPADAFGLPTKSVGDLFRFDPRAGALQRVKVSGQVLHSGPAGCFLLDDAEGLRFVPVDSSPAQVRDLVEVVGFPDLSGPSPILREAVVRRVGSADLPQPRVLRAEDLVNGAYDSTRVQVDGVLVGFGSRVDGSLLEMQNGLLRFAATLEDRSGLPEPLTVGSRLQLTGVYVGQGGNRVLGRPIDSFQLLLNSGADVRILSRPPWWTFRRLMMVVGLLFGVLLAALVWIKLLQRTVKDRTLQLESQIEQRQQAERQRAVEQERTRLAHDLHDDLGAGLAEVNMLTSLAHNPTTSPVEKVGYLRELSALALRMVTSLDEIVWAVNPRNDTIASLASYFGSYSQRVLELAGVSCGLHVAEDLPDHPLVPQTRRELFLAFKESLTNVVQHAAATKVWLRISIESGTLNVVVTDDGRGFRLTRPVAGADGLSNMRERLSALGGQCDIQSEPGKGTTVRFQVPLPGAAP